MDHPVEGSRQGSDLKRFLSEALTGLRRRELLLPALILLVLLTASNVVILQNAAVNGATPPLSFFIAALARVAGLLLIAVTILRVLTASGRRPWMPDGGFWLYALTFAASVAATGLARVMVGDAMDLRSLIASNVVVTLLLSPFVVWFVATAVARPLAWRPGPWLSGLWRWWPPMPFWTLLLVTPMAVLHASIDIRLARGVADNFWPLALFDGALSTAMALLGLSINAEAYRRVAQGPASRLSA